MRHILRTPPGLMLAALCLGVPLFADPTAAPPAATLLPPAPQAQPLATLLNAWERQTGQRFDWSLVDGQLSVPPMPQQAFWPAIEALAAHSKSRISLREEGRLIQFKPAGEQPVAPSSIEGPFRCVARELRRKYDFETGQGRSELELELHWEPRLEVFRVQEPRLLEGRDQAGAALKAPHFQVFKPVAGSRTVLRLPLDGLTAESRAVTLRGSVLVTLAEAMHRFAAPDLTKPHRTGQGGVATQFAAARVEGKTIILPLEMTYPRGGAVFESYETYWLRAHQLTLTDPAGKRHAVSQLESNGTKLNFYLPESPATGPLPAKLTGWSAELLAPGVLRDVEVPFRFTQLGWK